MAFALATKSCFEYFYVSVAFRAYPNSTAAQTSIPRDIMYVLILIFQKAKFSPVKKGALLVEHPSLLAILET